MAADRFIKKYKIRAAGAAGMSMSEIRFEWYFNKGEVKSALTNKQQRMLALQGYRVMKKIKGRIRKYSENKRQRTLTIPGTSVRVYVPPPGGGMMRDERTLRHISTPLAVLAKREFESREKNRKRRRQRPPRSVQGDFRKFIAFVADLQKQSVRIGPHVFGSQPRGLSGVNNVPELLEFGGRLQNYSFLARMAGAGGTWDYLPHPVVLDDVTWKFALRSWRRLAEETPL